MSKVVEHPSATSYRQKLERAARVAEEKEYKRQYRKRLKKTKPERDRSRALKHLRYTAEGRIGLAIDTAARALAERKYPSPDQASAFVEAYRDLTQKVIATVEGIVARAAGFATWNELQKAQGLSNDDEADE